MKFEEWENHLPENLRRPFNAAYAAAISGSGVGSGKFRHGAALYDGKILKSVGVNSYKTHPKMLEHSRYPYLHAECEAIFRYGIDNVEEYELYVLRVGKDDHIKLSEPCYNCANLCQDIKLKQVYYSRELLPEEVTHYHGVLF